MSDHRPMSSNKPTGPLGQQLRQPWSIDSFDDLTGRQRKVVLFAVALVGLVLSYSVIYHFGMLFLEGDDNSYFQSLQTVIETMTTTGYGADAPGKRRL
jgi:type II secretory pathway component PulM